jgi:hypothetical protein
MPFTTARSTLIDGRRLCVQAREYGYSQVGFKTLVSFIDLRNVASLAVAERMGAKYERTAKLFGSEAGIFRHLPPE